MVEKANKRTLSWAWFVKYKILGIKHKNRGST